MATIDILIAVDDAKLAQQLKDGSMQPGNEQSPTNLGSYGSSDLFISMIAQNSVAINDQGKSELTVVANSGDSLRWKITTFGYNIDHSVYLYSGQFNPASHISPLVYLPIQNTTYLPITGDPKTSPVKFHNREYIASATILTPGEQIQYTLSFKLVDNATGEVIGYFTWDPFINVNG